MHGCGIHFKCLQIIVFIAALSDTATKTVKPLSQAFHGVHAIKPCDLPGGGAFPAAIKRILKEFIGSD